MCALQHKQETGRLDSSLQHTREVIRNSDNHSRRSRNAFLYLFAKIIIVNLFLVTDLRSQIEPQVAVAAKLVLNKQRNLSRKADLHTV